MERMSILLNRNNESIQLGADNYLTYIGNVLNNALITASIDTTIDQDITLTGQLANAADIITLEAVWVEVVK